MRTLLLPALLLLGTAGCAREPGFRADEVLDWSIEKYGITYDACTNSPHWRSSFTDSLQRSEARRVVRLSSDAQTAKLLDCRNGPTSGCVPTDPEVVFAVDGNTLRFTKTIIQSVEDTTCRISFLQKIAIEDRGEEMTETYSYDYALVGDEEPCNALDAKIASQGNNNLGIHGCTVTVVSEGKL